MKRNSLFSLLAFLLISLNTLAVPARRGTFEQTQPDGTTITLSMHGDEYFHYLTTSDGTWVEKNAAGYYVPIAEAEKAARRERAVRRKAMRRASSSATPVNLAPRGLVILANFSDTKMQSDNTNAAFTEMLNADTYAVNGSYSSARQYFKDQSYGQYIPDFDVVGPVTAPNTMKYYGQNDGEGYDMYAHYLIRDVCQLVDDQVDFTKYDANDDGYVDFVFVIYAGYGEADSRMENTIWPHQWYLASGGGVSLSLDGKQVDLYACASELDGYSQERSGIATFCHEFSHVLGLPDIYSTDEYATHKTLGEWDLMDYGSYNNGGYTPPSYSAYERFMLGWLKPTILNEPTSTMLRDIQTNQEAYIITSTGAHNLVGNNPNPSSFYLLENRQQTGWDEYLPGHGMLITKISYSYSKWYNNQVNYSASSQGIDLIEADGKAPTSEQDEKSYYGKAGDAFPAGAASYSPYTTYPITAITEKDGVIAFDFMGGKGENVTGVSLDISSDYLFLGETLQLTATVRPVTALNKNVTWKTSNDKIATVDNAGLVTPHACGAVTITVTTEDGGFTATCELEVPCEYTVMVTSNNPEWGTVSGGGTAYEGDNVTLTATPATGYVFRQWSDGNTSNPRTITVSKDITLEAVFADKSDQSFAIAEGKYVVVCQRKTESNFFYMTSDLGSASTKRYQAVDAGTNNLTSVNAKDLDSKYVWEVEYGTNGILLKNGAKYSTWTTGNSANFNSIGKELTVALQPNGSYKLSLMDGANRVLSLNNQSSNNYFAYYEGTQKEDLYFIPYTASSTELENITDNKETVRKVFENGVMYILRPNGEKYTIDGRKVK